MSRACPSDVMSLPFRCHELALPMSWASTSDVIAGLTRNPWRRIATCADLAAKPGPGRPQRIRHGGRCFRTDCPRVFRFRGGRTTRFAPSAVLFGLGPDALKARTFHARRHCLSGAALGRAASLPAPAPGRKSQRSHRISGDRDSMSPCRVPPAATRGLRRKGLPRREVCARKEVRRSTSSTKLRTAVPSTPCSAPGSLRSADTGPAARRLAPPRA